MMTRSLANAKISAWPCSYSTANQWYVISYWHWQLLVTVTVLFTPTICEIFLI